PERAVSRWNSLREGPGEVTAQSLETAPPPPTMGADRVVPAHRQDGPATSTHPRGALHEHRRLGGRDHGQPRRPRRPAADLPREPVPADPLRGDPAARGGDRGRAAPVLLGDAAGLPPRLRARRLGALRAGPRARPRAAAPDLPPAAAAARGGLDRKSV